MTCGHHVADAATVDEPAAEPVTDSLLGRIAVVVGLAGLAVAQPVLGLFGDNPEFFVSGGYDAGQVQWFGIVVVVVPALACVGLVVVSSVVHRRLGSITYRALVGILGAFVASRFLVAMGIEAVAVVVPLAFAVGALVAVSDRRYQAAHLFLVYLAFGNLLYLGLFNFGSRTAELRSAGGDLAVGSVSLDDDESPVVLVILDELPLATIVKEDGSINAERFPNLARLAATSTWFRNTASRWSQTPVAVPEVLTGRLGEEGPLPTAADHPRNFFTMLGQTRTVHALEVATDLCPDRYCGSVPPAPISQAFEDAAIVHAHKVFPPAFVGGLPAIDEAYGGFVERDDAGDLPDVVDDESSSSAYELWRSQPLSTRSGTGQREAFRSVARTIDGSPSGHLIHVALPHSPWALTPYGDSRNSTIPPADGPGDSASDPRLRLSFQMHAMQVGATDALLGEMLDGLEAQGTLDDTLLVVTSDHGTSFTRPDLGRGRTQDNAEDLLRVPLFIKEVGQTSGRVDDAPAQTIDILPSIADLLGADLDWDFDGQSLFDDTAPERERHVDDSVQPLLDLAADRARWVRDDGWRGLAAVGPHGDLVGDTVAPSDVGSTDGRTIRFEQEADFDDLPTVGEKYPYVLTGVVQADERPRDLVVVVNGTIAGVLDGFYPVDGGWYFYGLVTDAYRRGSNEVFAASVDDAGVLHPLAPAG